MSEEENTKVEFEPLETGLAPTGTNADDPAGLASAILGLYTPKFNNAVDRLSSNALRRVLKKLVSFPLNDKDYTATSQGEAEVFAVGDKLLEAKYVLIYDQYAKIILANQQSEGKENG